MHPAYSVIVFTTLSGAGYGLLIWLAALTGLGHLPADRTLVLLGFGAALVMITVGLLSSTLHLGRPERAWRAFSQWRTSWLSREGVAAVFTYVPATLLAVYLAAFGSVDVIAVVLAVATIIGSIVTVYCTGMIYASLPTIRQWHHPLVPWVFLSLGLATGAVMLNLVLRLVQDGAAFPFWAALASLLIAAVLKLVYWSSVDVAPKAHTLEAATGLGRIGKVRPLEPAHSRANFVMREMGYEIGRAHATGLRRLVVAAAFLAPILLLWATVSATGAVALVGALLAVLCVAAGVGVERWLFFAEAQHVVTLYYRGGSA